jgi:hypothetical protein
MGAREHGRGDRIGAADARPPARPEGGVRQPGLEHATEGPFLRYRIDEGKQEQRTPLRRRIERRVAPEHEMKQRPRQRAGQQRQMECPIAQQGTNQG